MAGPPPTSFELPDDLNALVKSELVPGERVLWAGTPAPSPFEFSQGYGCAAIAAVGFTIMSAAFLGGYFGVFADPIPHDHTSLAVLGIVAGVLAIFVVMGMVAAWSEHRSDYRNTLRTVYALTDRRAILWAPAVLSEPLEIRSIGRGDVGHIHRAEHDDGTGDVIFTCLKNISGFKFQKIQEVRRVEDLARRILIDDDPREGREGSPTRLAEEDLP